MNSMELDAQMAAATATLEKFAEAEGIDLNTLSVSEIEQSLAQLMGVELPEDKTASDETQTDPAPSAAPAAAPAEQETKSASDASSDQVQLTNLDVSQALAKYAAAEGVDLTKLSREEYANVWNEMVDYLSSPQAEQDKTAAAEMQVKLAEADVTGRQFAQSFWDELQKLAAKDEDDKGEDKDHESKETAAEEAKEEAEKKASFMEKIKSMGKGVSEAAERVGKSVAEKERSASSSVGSVVNKALGSTAKTKSQRAAKDLSTGRKALGGAAVAGTLATGAGAAAHSLGKSEDKSEPVKEGSADLDALVTERARQILVGSGINPDSGAKFASDQEIVDFLAVEKLRAAGFEVG